MDEIILQRKDGKVLASSLDVAEKFRKRHDHILRDIDALIFDSPKLGSEMFHESTYKMRGREFKFYEMNRDGFSLLCMGFTGKRGIR